MENTLLTSKERELENELDTILISLTAMLTAYQKEVIKNSITDLSEIKLNVERIISESGYFEYVEKLLNTEYQDIINKVYTGYRKKIKEDFDIDVDTMTKLQNKKSIEADIYDDLANGLVTKLSENLINAGYNETVGITEMVTDDINSFARNNKTELTGTMYQTMAIATVGMGVSNGFEKFRYTGPQDEKNRPFCAEHVGEEKTMEEWEELDNGMLNPVSVYLGGYNCRHWFEAVA